jgi:hypothetical protein
MARANKRARALRVRKAKADRRIASDKRGIKRLEKKLRSMKKGLAKRQATRARM